MLNVHFLKIIILINKKNFNLKKTKNKNKKIDKTMLLIKNFLI